MSWMRAIRFVALGLASAYALPVACGSNGLVGGKCRKGASVCSDAAEGGRDQTTNATGGTPNHGGTNTEAGNGATNHGGDGELPDGGFPDSPVDGETDAEVPAECLPPHDAPSHCGDCDTTCSAPKAFCAPDGDGSFECVPECEAPFVECQGECVDPVSYNSDPDNCGECGNACPSDICQDGVCRGARFGNVVLLCSDLNSATSDSGTTALLGNAVFIPSTNPVKVLAYTRGASAPAVNKVNLLIAAASGPHSRTAEITEVDTVQAVTADLNIDDYQVLLIHDLDQAKSGDPAAAATTWESGSALTSFAKAGGVIVVLDGGDGTGEMNELINVGNLLDPTQKTSIVGQTQLVTSGESPMAREVWNNAPFDVIGVNVLSQFRATSHTCAFNTDAEESSDLIFVLTDNPKRGEGAPVAIHRVIAP